MIVIVETNFIVEIVLQQAHSVACEELLALGTSGAVRLMIPAFAVAEAGMMLERTGRERQSFINEEQRRQKKVGTAKVLRRYEAKLVELKNELLGAQEDSDQRWRHFRDDLDKLDVIPLAANMLEDTIAIQIGREIEKWPDTLVWASVRSYLESLRAYDLVTPAVFVSTDNAAFGDLRITKQLRKLECSYIHSFEDAVQYLRHRLR